MSSNRKVKHTSVVPPAPPRLIDAVPGFIALITIAPLWYFLKWPILVFGGIGAGMVLLIHIIHWCGECWPRTTLYVGWFIFGMIRGGRR